MRNKIIAFMVVTALAVSVSGCATTSKKSDLEIQDLKTQVNSLQTELQSKDDEISALRESLSKTTEEKYAASGTRSETGSVSRDTAKDVKVRFTVKQLQTALKNAGYDPGAVDGKMGKQTREAIKSFQKANGLSPDGVVGKRTWSLLKEYLAK
jgi:peptidoglycan hydrolase-like protein with peptidoglycan-binding domain